MVQWMLGKSVIARIVDCGSVVIVIITDGYVIISWVMTLVNLR